MSEHGEIYTIGVRCRADHFGDSCTCVCHDESRSVDKGKLSVKRHRSARNAKTDKAHKDARKDAHGDADGGDPDGGADGDADGDEENTDSGGRVVARICAEEVDVDGGKGRLTRLVELYVDTDRVFADEESALDATSLNADTVRELLQKHPLSTRPYFEARRRRRVPKSAQCAVRVSTGILDDFYLNLLDWGPTNMIALGSSSSILLLNPGTAVAEEHSAAPGSLSIARHLKSDENMQSRPLFLHPIDGGGLGSAARSAAPLEVSDDLIRSTLRSPLEGQLSHDVPVNRSIVVNPAAAETDYTALRWSPEGHRVAVGTRSGSVEIWDVEAGARVRTLTGHLHRVGAVDWIPPETFGHAQLLTSGSRDKLVIHHDLRADPSVFCTLDRHRQEVCGVKWRRQFAAKDMPERAAAAGDRDRRKDSSAAENEDSSAAENEDSDLNARAGDLFDRDLTKACSAQAFTTMDSYAAAQQALNSVLQDASTSALWALGTARSKLATGGNDNKVYIWELGYNTPLTRLSVHTAAVKALAWAPLPLPLLATGGGTNDRTIRLWDIENKRELATCETESQVCNIFWSPATLEIVSSHGYTLNQVNVWDLRRPTTSAEALLASHRSHNLPCSPKLLSFRKLATLTGHTARVLFMSGSPEGTRVCTAAGDGSVRVWAAFTDDNV